MCSRRLRLPLLLAACGLASVLVARSAHASCVAPEARIVWSYPAQGDTDVPTNVDLWVLASGWGPAPDASLNGVALAPLAQEHGHDLGQLEPDTTYTVELEWDVASPVAARAELTFTTGAGPSDANSAAAPGEVTPSQSADVALSEMCAAVLETQDCFDTGQNTHFLFEPTGSATAWLIVSDSGYRTVNVWPGACGTPQLFLHETDLPCVTLHGIDEVGSIHAGERVCATRGTPINDYGPIPDRPDELLLNDEMAGRVPEPLSSDAAGNGCSLGQATSAAPSSLWSALTALALIAMRRSRAGGR